MRSSTFWADGRSNQYLFTFNDNNRANQQQIFQVRSLQSEILLLLLFFSFNRAEFAQAYLWP